MKWLQIRTKVSLIVVLMLMTALMLPVSAGAEDLSDPSDPSQTTDTADQSNASDPANTLDQAGAVDSANSADTTDTATGATEPPAEPGTSDSAEADQSAALLHNITVNGRDTADVGVYTELELELKDQDGNLFKAPAGGQTIQLKATDAEGNSVGEFALQPSEIESYYTDSVVVPENESTVKVYYRSLSIGEQTLAFETSNSNEEAVSYEKTVSVTAAAGLYIDTEFRDMKAGQRIPVKLTVRDTYKNPAVSSDNREIELETSSPEGKFYADEESDEAVTSIIIPAGAENVTVYYEDTYSWTRKLLEEFRKTHEMHYLGVYNHNEWEYANSLAFRSEEVTGATVPVNVEPAGGSQLLLELANEPNVSSYPDDLFTQIGSKIGDYDIIGTADMLVGITDSYGNPVPQAQNVAVALKDNSESAFLIDDRANINYGDWAQYYNWYGDDTTEENMLVVTKPGTYQVTAEAGGLASAEASAVFEKPVIEMQTHLELNKRVPVILSLSNEWISDRDVTLQLNAGDQGSFYEDNDSDQPVTSVTLKANQPDDSFSWCQPWTVVWFETNQPEGTAVTIQAQNTELELDTSLTETVNRHATAHRYLERGWNIISTPWKLAGDKNTIDKVISDSSKVEVAYKYDGTKWVQMTTADLSTMKMNPLEAYYVKLKAAAMLNLYAAEEQTSPPLKGLLAGWNLVGSPSAYSETVNEAYVSVDGKWRIVVSPSLNQEAWVSTSNAVSDWNNPNGNNVESFTGNWIYMNEAGTFAGFETTPVVDNYDLFDLQNADAASAEVGK